MSDRAAKGALFDAFASVAAALGNGRRAEIVDVLAQGERSVEQVAAEVGQSVAATSHHLRFLAKAGLARARRDGNRVFYRLTSERVARRKAVVLDVRPEAEYRAGHIPGAISAPLERLEAIAPTLKKRREVVAYCRGPYCVYA